ncbi:MAG TPA: hypothetical protein VLI90_16280 [Tepidisphaeraceae bacterium]|nr:hypothetical protein [Tepidisphaeraceae bacterium]
MSDRPSKIGALARLPRNLALATWNHRGALKRAARLVFIRAYAAMILLAITAGGFFAVRYLVRLVFFPPTLPPRFVQWQGNLEVASLRKTDQPGVEMPAMRSPIGHYHGVDRWFQPDNTNGCTLSGCHEPLPHGEKSKVPAFANFHTTFLQCQMCHAPAANHPASASWVNTSTARTQSTPAILQLLAYLELNADAIQNDPASVSPKIVALLRESINILGGDALLDGLLAQIETSEPGSPVWKHAMIELTAELPLHARGEYRAKLAWSETADGGMAKFAKLTEQSKQYLPLPKDDPQRKELNAAIHGGLDKEAATCLSCHGDKPAMIDFTAVGYTPKRAAFLGQLEVARLMQQIRRGERFFIPNMVGAENAK